MSPVQYDDGIVGAVRGHLIHVLLLAGLRCTGKVEHDYAPFTIYGICGQTWHPLYHLGLARRLPLWAVLEPPTRRATWPACWPPPTSCSPARGCATRLISWGEVGTGAFLLLRAALTRILVGPRVLAWCGEGAGSWEGSNCKSLIFAPFFLLTTLTSENFTSLKVFNNKSIGLFNHKHVSKLSGLSPKPSSSWKALRPVSRYLEE